MSVTDLFPAPAAGDARSLQFATSGHLRHLLTLQGLSRAQISGLLDYSETFLSPPGDPPPRSTLLEGRTVANLFFEPSTRTRASFDLAAKRLGADVLNLDVNT
ncbi:MAG: aspartate carbamoyltransferase catalytic subunit, partial [Woeseiaceae bacterium]